MARDQVLIPSITSFDYLPWSSDGLGKKEERVLKNSEVSPKEGLLCLSL